VWFEEAVLSGRNDSSDQSVGFCAAEAGFQFAGIALEVFLEALVFWCWLLAEAVECSAGHG
jgi:hypothetical protein